MVNTANTLTAEEAQARWLGMLRHFYYDTALSAVDPVFTMLRDTVGLDRVVFGSDFPQASPALVRANVRGLQDSKVLSSSEKSAIAQETILGLMPQLAERIAK